MPQPNPIYRPVPGYTDLYAGIDGTIVHGTTGALRAKTSPTINCGYLSVYVPKMGYKPVHLLVAAAYLAQRPEGIETRHVDGTRSNARLENLCYGTRSDNQKDSVRHGTHRNIAKTKCPQGHYYGPEDTYIDPSSGWRQCRQCRAQHVISYEIQTRQIIKANAEGISITEKHAIADRLLAEGLSIRQVARRSGVSHTTVRLWRERHRCND